MFFLLFFFFCSVLLSQVSVSVDIETNFTRLLSEEDTDQDNKITLEDKALGAGRGDKRFAIVTTEGKKLEIIGNHYLSNLLQEMSLQRSQGKKIGMLEASRVFENGVSRLSRQIRERFWNGLTRRIDGPHLKKILQDSKTNTQDGFRYLYVPYADTVAFDYFSDISQKDSSLHLKVVRMPQEITPAWLKSIEAFPGILTLQLRKNREGELEGVPFVVPGGRFNEMYGWDSYFESLGLIEDGRVDLAQGMVDNFVYEIEHYGKILNANRTYYLSRSQPPFLTSMGIAVYRHLPQTAESKEWIRTVLLHAIVEYRNVWMGEKRLTPLGLSRYYGEGLGQPQEVEEGHFSAVYEAFAPKYKMTKDDLQRRYTHGEIILPEMDLYFTHDRSMRESGHDTTYRWEDRCADFVTVDLNSLLYKIETDLAEVIEKEWGGKLPGIEGADAQSATWKERAQLRKKRIHQYLWNEKAGFFYDYDLLKEKQKEYPSATALYPLWAGCASEEQAKRLIPNALKELEEPGGLVSSSQKARGELSSSRPGRQWDYPYGWAPHQMIAWEGLMKYNHAEDAYRLMYRWLYTIARNAVDYNGVVPEKYDVVQRTHQVFVEYGNVGTDFSYITEEGFGWMNASYQVGLKLLPPSLRASLNDLVPPEWIFP